jgi:hypothetical protein
VPPIVATAAPKKRGRPPKAKAAAAVVAVAAPASAPAAAPKKRGRPPKAASAAAPAKSTLATKAAKGTRPAKATKPAKAAKAPAKPKTLPYEYYVDIVTKRYFDGVDTKDMAKVLDCFAPDAVLTEVTTGTVHKGRDKGIKSMFEKLFADFGRIWHGNFVHTVDPKANAVCSQFSVEIAPKGKAGDLRYENSNRFYLKGDKFHRVYVYMSGDNLLK